MEIFKRASARIVGGICRRIHVIFDRIFKRISTGVMGARILGRIVEEFLGTISDEILGEASGEFLEGIYGEFSGEIIC